MQPYSCLLFCSLAKHVSIQEFYHEKVLSCQDSYMAQVRGGFIEMDLSYTYLSYTASFTTLVVCRFALDFCYSEVGFVISYRQWSTEEALERQTYYKTSSNSDEDVNIL